MITEEQFYEKYELVTNHFERAKQPISVADEDICCFGGKMFETHGEDFEFVREMAKENRVVTILEGDTDEIDEEGDYISSLWYVSGLHFVNRMGYLITTKPIEEYFNINVD
jgi:hypothetical protein